MTMACDLCAPPCWPPGVATFDRIAREVLTCFPAGLGIKPPRPDVDGEVIRKVSPRHQRATSTLVRILEERAPPKPACFRSQEDWVRYLHQAESSGEIRVLMYVGRTGKGEANRGRIKTGQINPEIDYCRDCTGAQRDQMRAAGRCHPPAAAGVTLQAIPALQALGKPAL